MDEGGHLLTMAVVHEPGIVGSDRNDRSYHHHLVHDGDYRVELTATGEFRFTNPRGRVIPEVPCPAKPPDKPLAELELEGWEGKPKWGYEPIDLPLVIDTMWRPGGSPG